MIQASILPVSPLCKVTSPHPAFFRQVFADVVYLPQERYLPAVKLAIPVSQLPRPCRPSPAPSRLSPALPQVATPRPRLPQTSLFKAPRLLRRHRLQRLRAHLAELLRLLDRQQAGPAVLPRSIINTLSASGSYQLSLLQFSCSRRQSRALRLWYTQDAPPRVLFH